MRTSYLTVLRLRQIFAKDQTALRTKEAPEITTHISVVANILNYPFQFFIKFLSA
jgi:hypothetical protein